VVEADPGLEIEAIGADIENLDGYRETLEQIFSAQPGAHREAYSQVSQTEARLAPAAPPKCSIAGPVTRQKGFNPLTFGSVDAHEGAFLALQSRFRWPHVRSNDLIFAEFGTCFGMRFGEGEVSDV
jgi:hypothetical protein